MKLDMGRIEVLQFILYSTYSVEALVLYALTNEEGAELSEFLERLIQIMFWNFIILMLIVVYEYVIKPAICRPSTRSHASSSVTSPNSDAFSLGGTSTTISAL